LGVSNYPTLDISQPLRAGTERATKLKIPMMLSTNLTICMSQVIYCS
jgi:hypothetical protein